MRLLSTRSKLKVSFREALFMGLAPDGGLFLPDHEPDLSSLIASFTAAHSFQDVAMELSHTLLKDELNSDQISQLVTRAFPFAPSLRPLHDSITLLELFYGPSASFKDFGAGFLAAAMELFLSSRQHRLVILTATSGDTGSAVAEAFFEKECIDVVVLYPSGKVSPLQERQMTTLGGNIHAVEVRGNFDDCQRMVKAAFMDSHIPIHLSSANSINIGRLIPQSFYYVFASAQLNRAISFCVPSGNFGNICAAVLAWRWGMHTGPFLAATNANDEVPHYLLTGSYEPRPSIPTYANAMDVGSPSNFERLLAICDRAGMMLKDFMHGISVSDAQILSTIATCYRDYGLFICPHTATGLHTSEHFLRKGLTEHVVCLSPADPGKFLEVVEKATGTKPPLPSSLTRVLHKDMHAQTLPAEDAALKEFLLDTFPHSLKGSGA